MLQALTLLLGCQLAGEIGARLTGVPVPGPVIGLALLFAGLMIRERQTGKPLAEDAPVSTTANGILANLSLLFVPAGTGIIQQSGTLEHFGVGLVIALVVSSAAAIAVTALVFNFVAKRMDAPPEAPAPETQP